MKEGVDQVAERRVFGGFPPGEGHIISRNAVWKSSFNFSEFFQLFETDVRHGHLCLQSGKGRTATAN